MANELTQVGFHAAWQFLNKTADPRVSMLRRFAKAVGVDVRELFKGEK